MNKRPIPGTGRKLKTKKWMIRLAVLDSKGYAVPLFESNRLNRKLLRMADSIAKRRTHRGVG